MASALIVLFLGCWLAGRSGVSGKSSYPKPSISLRPSGGVTLGGAVTIQCWGRHQNMRFLLYKDGNPTALQDVEPAGKVAEFPIRNVSWRDAGNYSCYYHDKGHQVTWSYPSNPVELVVTEPRYPKPNISLRPSGQVTLGGAVTIRCECQCQGARVRLSKAGDPDARRSIDPAGHVAEFPICNVSQGDAGSYSCQYSTKWDPPIWSEPSDLVQLVVSGGTDPTHSGTTPTSCSCGVGPGNESKGSESPSTTPKTEGTTSAGPKQPNPTTMEPEGEGRTDSTQSGTTPASTHPGRARPSTRTGGRESSSNQTWKQPHPGGPTNWVAFLPTGTTKPPLRGTGGSEPSPAPGLTRTIIAGVSAAAAGLLLLLLLVAFLCYRRTRGGKGPAPKQTRESEPATTVYALRGEGTQLDVLLQEPDPGAKGLTYAELDGQALQAKRGGPAPAPEPVLYATIDVS